MIDSVYVKQGLVEGEDEQVDGVISDKAAGLYGSFYSIGMIISPIAGSVIFENFKKQDETNAFNKTCDVFAALTLVYTVIYFLFNVLPDINKDKAQQRAISMEHSTRLGSIYSLRGKHSPKT
jgi:hypothetical protein